MSTKKDNVIVIGSGSREHVIVSKLTESSSVNKIYVYPGNSGMVASHKVDFLKIPENSNLNQYIVQFCKSNDVDIVVVGPEQYLVDGISDVLEAENIYCFGPSKSAARIEGSKLFSKQFMKTHDIPTANFTSHHGTIDNECMSFIQSRTNQKPEYVIKLDHLASGKGVFIPETVDETIHIMKQNFDDTLIIEDKLIGEEVSIMGFCNGKDISLMPQSQDHKRVYDNDQGPNTGGMGAYAPASVLTPFEIEDVKNHMLKVVKELDYVGVLYAGIMKTDMGVYFLEFNCRFGDPEAQVVLNLLDSDLYEIIKNCVKKEPLHINWKPGFVANVVLSHLDYPASKLKTPVDMIINPTQLFLNNIKIYWNTIDYDLTTLHHYTIGGRVASVVYYSSISLKDAIKNIYSNIKTIHYDDIYYRHDIGLKELTRQSYTSKHVKIGILSSSKGTSLQLLIDKIKSKEVKASINVIISNKKDAYILERAKNEGIPSIYSPCKKGMTKTEYDTQLVNLLRIYEVDVLYLIGYNKIVSNVLINEFNDKILNIHPSLLPRHKGLFNNDVHKSVIDMEDKISGCTLHQVTEEVDSGSIVLQRQCIINNNKQKFINNVDELKTAVQKLESEVIVDSVKLFSNESWNYKQSGVDIDEGNKLVSSIKNLSKDTKKHIGGFCAIYEHDNLFIGASTDGVGTKLDLAIKLNKFDTIGIDLVAMCVNDLLVCGVKPLFFLDYLAIDKINNQKCETIIKGIHDGCLKAKCQLIGGETAEMKGIYFKDKFDLAGFSVGSLIRKFPREIKSANFIYGIKSTGIHSNGYTLINKILNHMTPEELKFENESFKLKDFLTPTKIYIEILDLINKFDDSLVGMAHITGGGIIDNLPRILPPGMTFNLNVWEFPDIFKWIQTKTQMSDIEMLRTYNCGYGLVLIFNEKITGKHNNYGMDYLGQIVEGETPKLFDYRDPLSATMTNVQ